jgi:hypothetical protein
MPPPRVQSQETNDRGQRKGTTQAGTTCRVTRSLRSNVRVAARQALSAGFVSNAHASKLSLPVCTHGRGRIQLSNTSAVLTKPTTTAHKSKVARFLASYESLKWHFEARSSTCFRPSGTDAKLSVYLWYTLSEKIPTLHARSFTSIKGPHLEYDVGASTVTVSFLALRSSASNLQRQRREI